MPVPGPRIRPMGQHGHGTENSLARLRHDPMKCWPSDHITWLMMTVGSNCGAAQYIRHSPGLPLLNRQTLIHFHPPPPRRPLVSSRLLPSSHSPALPVFSLAPTARGDAGGRRRDAAVPSPSSRPPAAPAPVLRRCR